MAFTEEKQGARIGEYKIAVLRRSRSPRAPSFPPPLRVLEGEG
jgi:hypothetical protein